MHKEGSGMEEEVLLSGNIPAFLVKLWRLVADPETNNLISWSKNGTTFTVHDPSTFARDVLPKFFKHNNFASFVRQLNMYGFKKVVAVEQGGLKHEKDEWEFHHPNFLKDNIQMLDLVKRKAHPEEKKVKSNDLDRIIGEINGLKGKHENFKIQMDSLRMENELLWRQVGDLREKHRRQQHVINKLIKFFLSLAYGNKGKGIPTRKRLAIEAGSASAKRRKAAPATKISETTTSDFTPGFDYSVQSPPSISPTADLDSSPGSTGPQITVLPDDNENAVDGLPVIYSSDLPVITTAVAQGSAATSSTASSTTTAQPLARGDIAAASNSMNNTINKPQKVPRKGGAPRKKLTKLEMPSKALALDPTKMMSPNTMSLLDSLVFPEESAPTGSTVEEVQSSSSFPSRAVIPASPERDGFDQHIHHISEGLESLQGLLSSGQFNFDTNALHDGILLHDVHLDQNRLLKPLPTQIFTDYPSEDLSQNLPIITQQPLQQQLQEQGKTSDDEKDWTDNTTTSGQEVVQYTRPFSPGQFLNDFSDSIQADQTVDSPPHLDTGSLLE